MAVTVLSNGGSKSEPFIVETGVKQGCVIAPTLFAIFIAAILHLIGEELPQGIPIMYRTDGRLFNLNRFKAKSKVNCTTITELQYADDNVIAAHSAEDLQGILNAFAMTFCVLPSLCKVVNGRLLDNYQVSSLPHDCVAYRTRLRDHLKLLQVF